VSDQPPPERADAAGLQELAALMATEARYWRERCARYEAHHAKLEQAAAEIRGRVEQFLTVLQHARPQGTERRASEER